MAIGRIDRAHQMYLDGHYGDALSFYTDALSLARTKPQQIALHSNRAACFLKLHDFKKDDSRSSFPSKTEGFDCFRLRIVEQLLHLFSAAEECTSVVELDHEHTGALMLPAQTLVTLKEYHSALFDVNRLIELNPSSEVYKNLEARLRTQLSLAPIPELEEELEEEEEEHGGAELCPARDKMGPCNVAGLDTDASSQEKRSTLTLSFFSAVTRRLQGEGPSGRVGAMKIAPDDVSSTQSCTNEEEDTKGWQAIPKPKGHSTLDYARWDRVEDSSSDDDDKDNEDDSACQYRFRVGTVGMRPVK